MRLLEVEELTSTALLDVQEQMAVTQAVPGLQQPRAAIQVPAAAAVGLVVMVETNLLILLEGLEV
tara:strand:- start:194 stop:388 length:195 start_codon:yes stop_codon:yes gene_type:complete